jgi:hypothetical protein
LAYLSWTNKSAKESPRGFKLREIEAESKFCRELSFDAIAQAVPVAVVQAVLAESGACEQRERKLNMLVTVFLTIAMNLYPRASIGEVLRKIAQGLRYIWPDPSTASPTTAPSRSGATN